MFFFPSRSNNRLGLLSECSKLTCFAKEKATWFLGGEIDEDNVSPTGLPQVWPEEAQWAKRCLLSLLFPSLSPSTLYYQNHHKSSIMFYPLFPYHSTCFFALLAQSQDNTMPGRVPQIHFSLFSRRNGQKTSKAVRLVWTRFCMEPARGSWLPWKHMHFPICRKRSSFDWLCTPVLCPTTGFGVTTDCSKHPEKASLSVVGCSRGDKFYELAGGLRAKSVPWLTVTLRFVSSVLVLWVWT